MPGGRRTFLERAALLGLGGWLGRRAAAEEGAASRGGSIPVQTPHLLKAYMRQEGTIARCQVRGGVHLDAGYVTDVCLSARFNQCVFYEEEIVAF